MDDITLELNSEQEIVLETQGNAGVSSFNGRTGAVVPTAGDYSFGMLSGTSNVALLNAGNVFTNGNVITIADTVNTVGLTVNQNNVTHSPDAVSITNLGTGDGLQIVQTGNGRGLFIDSEATTADVLRIEGITTTGRELVISSLGAKTGTNNGNGVLAVYNNNAGSTGIIAQVVEDNASASAITFRVVNAGTGNGIYIDQNGDVGIDRTTDGALFIENTGNPGIALNVYSTMGAGQASPMIYFSYDNAAFDQPLLFVEGNGALAGYASGMIHFKYSGTQFGDGPLLFLDVNGSGNTQGAWIRTPVTVGTGHAALYIDANHSGNGIFLDSKHPASAGLFQQTITNKSLTGGSDVSTTLRRTYHVTDGGSYVYNGVVLSVTNDVSITSGSLVDDSLVVDINQNNSASRGVVISVDSAGTGTVFDILHTGVLASGSYLMNVETLGDLTNTNRSVARIASNVANTGGRILQVIDDHASSVLDTVQMIHGDGIYASGVLRIHNNNNSLSMQAIKTVTNKNATTGGILITNTSVVNDAATYTKTGTVLTVSSTVTQSSGTITDSCIVLALTQSNSASTGIVGVVTNAGTGAGFQILNTNAGTPVGLTVTNSGAGIGADLIGGVAGANTIMLGLRSQSTTTNTETSIRFVSSTATTSGATSGTAEIGAIRTNAPGNGDTYLVFRTTLTERFRIGLGGFVIADGMHMSIGVTNGMMIGTTTAQKWATHGSTPTIQRVGAYQAAVTTTAATQTTPWGYATQAQADGVITLLNELRAMAIEKGFIKGSA